VTTPATSRRDLLENGLPHPAVAGPPHPLPARVRRPVLDALLVLGVLAWALWLIGA
jgi:hypothetical protein